MESVLANTFTMLVATTSSLLVYVIVTCSSISEPLFSTSRPIMHPAGQRGDPHGGVRCEQRRPRGPRPSSSCPCSSGGGRGCGDGRGCARC